MDWGLSRVVSAPTSVVETETRAFPTKDVLLVGSTDK